MKIKVDIDNVIRDMGSEMVQIYNDEFKCHLKKQDIFDYDVSISFPKLKENNINAKEFFFVKHALETYTLAKPMKGAVEGLELAKKLGFEIIIVSYQPLLDSKIRTLDWLQRNKIPYDSLVFVNNEDKLLVQADYIIDDNPKHLDNDPAKTVCIDWPYNRKNKYDYRVKSILEFVKQL